MVGETKVYQGQRVQVMGIVNGDEVVIQLPDGHRIPVYRSELTDPPKPASNRPIITKTVESSLELKPVVNTSTETKSEPEKVPEQSATPPEEPKTEDAPPAAPEAPAAPETPAAE